MHAICFLRDAVKLPSNLSLQFYYNLRSKTAYGRYKLSLIKCKFQVNGYWVQSRIFLTSLLK